jgi:transposase
MKKQLSFRQVVQYRKRVLADAEKQGVTKTARLYGIHRDTVYAWRAELEPKKPGPDGGVPSKTDEETEALILQLRLATGHGPKRLVHELADIGVTVGEKAIRQALERADLVNHQKKPRHKAAQEFYNPYPGYRLQVDTKAVEDGGKDKRSTTRYQFTAIDIATRIRYLALYDSLSNYNSICFVKDALAFFEELDIHVECVQTDNHSTFTNLYIGGNKKNKHDLLRPHPLTEYLESRGIEHKLSRPGTPRHNGFVERSHRTDEEDFYGWINAADLARGDLEAAVKAWQNEYNNQRLHSSCDYLPPMEHYLGGRREVVMSTS